MDNILLEKLFKRLVFRGVFLAILVGCGAMLSSNLSIPFGEAAPNTDAVVILKKGEELGDTGLVGRPPVKLIVPAIKVNADVVSIGLDKDQALVPPDDPEIMGWWNASAKPGRGKGQTIITGHAKRDGTAPLNRLKNLRIDQTIIVKTKKDSIKYKIVEINKLPRSEVVDHEVEFFSQQQGDGRLVLISCDDWNGEDYLTNIFVFAEPVK